MKISNGFYTSDGGSVKYLDGQFYTAAWSPLFTPLDQREYQMFVSQVEASERKANRRLTRAELIVLVDRVTGVAG